MICFDSDDFGCDHIISDMCQSHDCRDALEKLKAVNPTFKATLFTIPAEMTMELAEWATNNRDWIELAVHGFYHTSNYECEKMSYNLVDNNMEAIDNVWDGLFIKGFKAPGWQISDDIYRWLKDNGWWVADQPYNDDRRPEGLPAYVIGANPEIISIHTHTWNCVGNGIYELFDQLAEQIRDETEFKFVSEVLHG